METRAGRMAPWHRWALILPAWFLVGAVAYASEKVDPWKALREIAGEKTAPEVVETGGEGTVDPWARLRTVFLPFTEKDEESALKEPSKRRPVARGLHRILEPYQGTIRRASRMFAIPEEIIGAVIIVESGGDPRAKAPCTTAGGLMQTIASTFREARQGLMARGIRIKNDFFDAYASIMAGSWYLARMFEKAASDPRTTGIDRMEPQAWKLPLEYYYAGPGNGRKARDVVIVYRGGRKVGVDKSAYSQKVLRWAAIMRGEDFPEGPSRSEGRAERRS